MKSIFLFFLSFVALCLAVTVSQSSTNSAPDGECFVCHTDIADSADIKITGIPKEYIPGKTYNITLTVQSRLKSMSQIKGGFSAIATAGELIVIDTKNTQKSNSYITHTIEGAKNRTWKFAWKSPTEKIPAEISVMAVASNGDFSPTGDAITAESITMKPSK